MLSDSPDQIVQKIKKAKTDPLPLPTYSKEIFKRPEAFNLLSIFASLKGISTENATQQYEGKEFSLFKKDLADLVVEKIQPIGKEINKLMDDQLYLDSIMTEGKNKAVVEADSVLTKVYDIIGLQKS
jgi:tryptophanyl-tRNA synthetase